jgi:O-acetyl-ADP-ribose deacetylase (regulator of RNase III)
VKPAFREIGRARVELVRGDLTRESVDVIVNAANSTLMGGGGVDGAIHRRGGPRILEECRRIIAERGPLPSGEAVITSAGDMAARHVIHTVGPIWRGGAFGEAEILARSYQSSLRLAVEHDLATVAFPSISTGVYGYPVDRAARVALGAVKTVLETDPPLRLVRFVLFTESDLAVYSAALDDIC